MSWDALQRDVLNAMGHTVYRMASASEAVTLDATQSAREPAASGGRRPEPDAALLGALLRAAGRDPAAADADALHRAWAPLARLRTAAAKRALWPQLRALRRDTPGRSMPSRSMLP